LLWGLVWVGGGGVGKVVINNYYVSLRVTWG